MRKCLSVVFLSCVFVLPFHPVKADEQAIAANQLLAAQLADAVSTRALLRMPDTHEVDPLARPFVKSDLGAIGFFVAQNLVERILFRHAPKVLRALTFLELGAVANNSTVIIFGRH